MWQGRRYKKDKKIIRYVSSSYTIDSVTDDISAIVDCVTNVVDVAS